MKRLSLMLCAAFVLLLSCNAFDNFGTKLNIAENFDVYYKGDNVTEAEAKKLGDYWMELRKENNITTEQTLQLTKEGDAYVVHVPAKPEDLKNKKEKTLMQMWIMQDLISQGAFDGKRTKIVLTDQELKTVETLEDINKVAGGEDKKFVLFYRGAGLDEKEAQDIADKLVQSQFSSYTAGDAILSKVKGDYEVRFFPNAELQKENGAEYNATLQRFQYLIGKYVLEGKDVRLFVIDDSFEDVEDFDELPQDQRLALDEFMRQSMEEGQTTASESEGSEE